MPGSPLPQPSIITIAATSVHTRRPDRRATIAAHLGSIGPLRQLGPRARIPIARRRTAASMPRSRTGPEHEISPLHLPYSLGSGRRRGKDWSVWSGKLASLSLRRLLTSTKALVAMLAILAPMSLGPATGALARALGALDHACACGMTPGKCGCPACARLERERTRQTAARPVLEANCERETAAPPTASWPPCTIPRELALEASETAGSVEAPIPAQLQPFDSDGPPTPPPRV